MPVATFPLGPLATNSYLLHDAKNAVCIDVGGQPDPILAYLKEHGLTLAAICLTHLHFDHLYGVAELEKASGLTALAPVGDEKISQSESSQGGIWGFPPVPPFTSQALAAGEQNFGGLACRVLDTPGHTPGGISLYFPKENAVFTGDALFYRSLGRTDFPFGDQATLLRSIREVLFRLPDGVIVYPGHGPATTIGDERRENPFCGESGA